MDAAHHPDQYCANIVEAMARCTREGVILERVRDAFRSADQPGRNRLTRTAVAYLFHDGWRGYAFDLTGQLDLQAGLESHAAHGTWIHKRSDIEGLLGERIITIREPYFDDVNVSIYALNHFGENANIRALAGDQPGMPSITAKYAQGMLSRGKYIMAVRFLTPEWLLEHVPPSHAEVRIVAVDNDGFLDASYKCNDGGLALGHHLGFSPARNTWPAFSPIKRG